MKNQKNNRQSQHKAKENTNNISSRIFLKELPLMSYEEIFNTLTNLIGHDKFNNIYYPCWMRLVNDRNLEEMQKFLKMFNIKNHGVKLNNLYESLIYCSTDIEFQIQVADLIKENLILQEEYFYNKEAVEYISHHMHLTYLEKYDVISNAFNKTITGKRSKAHVKIKRKHSKKEEEKGDFKTLEGETVDLRSAIDNLYVNFSAGNVPKEHKKICVKEYVSIKHTDHENENQAPLIGQVLSIDSSYNIKIKFYGELSGDHFIITKLNNSTVEDVVLNSLIEITEKSRKLDPIKEMLFSSTNRIKDLADAQVNKLGTKQDYAFSNKTLNNSQKEAILRALTNRLTLVHGPPGTGKTATAVEIIREWIKNDTEKGISTNGILVSADSNIAVENLQLGLKEIGIPSLRIGNNSNINEYLCSSKPHTDYPLLKKTMSTIKVVCTTCVSSSSIVLDKKQFQRVIIDESTQSTEISNLPCFLKHAEQVVLLGDHKQLPPTISSFIAAKRGLNVSLFERLVKLGVQPILLNTQYRMHPSLSTFPSKCFYNNEIIDGITDSHRPIIKGFEWPNKDFRVAFINIESKESSHGTSYFNNPEIDVVVDVVSTFIKSGLKPNDIGVITPYDVQRRMINDKLIQSNLVNSGRMMLLSNKAHESSPFEVKSVDGFQGREKELIIFSAVRSNENGSLGFVSDPRRINVMLTRAKSGLIIIGNKNTLSNNKDWKSWLNWVDDNGLTCNSFSSFNQLKKEPSLKNKDDKQNDEDLLSTLVNDDLQEESTNDIDGIDFSSTNTKFNF